MKRQVTIIRIDPFKSTIARIPMLSGKSPAVGTREAKRILRCTHVGFRQLVELEPVPLMCAGRLDVEESMCGWRFAGSEATAGISFLFGRGPGGGMTDCPVDVAWVEKRIIWMHVEFDTGEGEYQAGEAAE